MYVLSNSFKDAPAIRLSWQGIREVIAYSAAVAACSHAAQWDLALSLLRAAPKSNAILWDSCITVCLAARQWPMALELLKEQESLSA